MNWLTQLTKPTKKTYQRIDLPEVPLSSIPRRWQCAFFWPVEKCIGWSETHAQLWLVMFGYIYFRVCIWTSHWDYPPPFIEKKRSLDMWVNTDNKVDVVEYRTSTHTMRVEKKRSTGRIVRSFVENKG